MTSKILLPYENKWVALNPSRTKVLESADSIKELDKKIRKKGELEAIFLRVLPFKGAYSP